MISPGVNRLQKNVEEMEMECTGYFKDYTRNVVKREWGISIIHIHVQYTEVNGHGPEPCIMKINLCPLHHTPAENCKQ